LRLVLNHVAGLPCLNPEQGSRIARLDAGRPPRSHLAVTNRRERNMVGIIVWIIVGGIVGWLASLIMRTDAQQGILMNIVVGIVGAVIASLIVGGGTINSDPMDLTNILWSLLGAVILLAIVNLIRRGSVR
jgi:uncharacterized membrane protein YeaQ/YmgE (transglycosylase-associated protein family)